MKKLLTYIYLLALGALATGCEKDNYDAPSAFIKGKLMYQNEPVYLRNAASEMELWQDGFPGRTKIPVYINQDGEFSANVFDGTYKLVQLRNTGPWVPTTDTTVVQVNGTANVDVQVTPYFMVRNVQISRTGNTVTATCSIQNTASTGTLEHLAIFVGSTNILDHINQAGVVTKAAGSLNPMDQQQSISIELPQALIDKGYFYARVGVKTVGVQERIYSATQKIQ